MNSETGQPKTRRGVLLTTDLLFSTKVTGTASALGQEVAVAGNVAKAVGLCRARPCAYVIIDLGMAEIEIETAVTQLREAAGAVPTIAYGSHVDKARLDEARAAGCDEVLPRSKFSAELPALLGRYFDGNCQGRETGTNATERTRIVDVPPKQVRGFKEEKYLQIAWEEGHVGIYPYRYLRGECHCASCVDEWTGVRRLDLASIPENIILTDMQLVGNYAIKFVWSDGHSTGIYTWKRLRDLCPCTRCKGQ